MGVHGIVEDMNKLQMGELPEEELRALEADLTGKVLFPLAFPTTLSLSLGSASTRVSLLCLRTDSSFIFTTDSACFMAWHALRDHPNSTGSGG